MRRKRKPSRKSPRSALRRPGARGGERPSAQIRFETHKSVADADITRLLNEASRGDRKSESRVIDLLYDTFLALADSSRLRGRSGDPASLLNLPLIRVIRRRRGKDWHDRHHFIRSVMAAIRNAQIDKHRRRKRDERTMGGTSGELDDLPSSLSAFRSGAAGHGARLDWRTLLNKLAAEKPEAWEVLKQRVYGCVPLDVIARRLGISKRTAERRFKVAVIWICSQLDVPPAA